MLTLLATLAAAAPATASGDLVLVDADTGAKRVVASGQRTYWDGRPCITPEGAVVAAGSTGRGRHYVEHRPDGTRRTLGRTGPANTIVLAPGCARVAEGRLKMPGRPRESGLVVRTPPSLQPLAELLSYWPVEGPWMAWSNDGGRIADIDDSGRREAVRITDVVTGSTIARARVPLDHASILDGAFSPDGNQVLLHQHDWHRTRGIVAEELTIFDAVAGTFRPLLSRPVGPRRGGIGWSAWSPRGDRIAVELDDRIHLFDLEGRDLGVIAPGRDGSAAVWSPDGTRIAFRTLRPLRRPRNPRSWPVPRYAVDVVVAPAEPGARGRTVLRDLGEEMPAWSPDGRSLAAITSR